MGVSKEPLGMGSGAPDCPPQGIVAGGSPVSGNLGKLYSSLTPFHSHAHSLWERLRKVFTALQC